MKMSEERQFIVGLYDTENCSGCSIVADNHAFGVEQKKMPWNLISQSEISARNKYICIFDF